MQAWRRSAIDPFSSFSQEPTTPRDEGSRRNGASSASHRGFTLATQTTAHGPCLGRGPRQTPLLSITYVSCKGEAGPWPPWVDHPGWHAGRDVDPLRELSSGAREPSPPRRRLARTPP